MHNESNTPIQTPTFLDVHRWLRVAMALIFLLANSFIVRPLIWLTSLFQAAMLLITGSPNAHVLAFTASLARYSYELVRFVSFNSTIKPFPFAPWPQDDA